MLQSSQDGQNWAGTSLAAVASLKALSTGLGRTFRLHVLMKYFTVNSQLHMLPPGGSSSGGTGSAVMATLMPRNHVMCVLVTVPNDAPFPYILGYRVTDKQRF